MSGLRSIVQELRNAMRSLAKSPGFLASSVLMLAFGLALSTFVMGAVNAFLFTEMPFQQPDRLVYLGYTNPQEADDDDPMPARHYLALREGELPFESIAAYSNGTVNLSSSGDSLRPARYDGEFVGGELFATLGVQPVLGRGIQPADDQPGAPLVIVIGHDVWLNRFLGDGSVIGREIRVNSEPATIVGVMPEGFGFPYRQQVWMPMRLDPNADRGSIDYEVNMVARLRDDMSIGQAREALSAAVTRMLKRFPGYDQTARPWVEDFRESFISRTTKTMLLALSIGAVLVLLIAAINVANLMIARGVRRQREMAVRSAIGAGRQRIMLAVLCESLIIAGLAAAIGAGLSEIMVMQMVQLMTEGEDLPAYWIRIEPNMVVFGWLAVLGLVTALLAGWFPARRAARMDLTVGLKDGSGASGVRMNRLSRVMVAAEVAMSFVLLFSFGLMTRSVLNIGSLDPGADISNTLTGRVGLFEEKYPTPASRLDFVERLQARLAGIPGVDGATVSTVLPVAYPAWSDVEATDKPPVDNGRPPRSQDSVVSNGYFDLFDIPLLEGRVLGPEDGSNAVPAVVVNRLFVERILDGAPALGRQLRIGAGDDQRMATIVGVVGNVVHDANDFDEGYQPVMYSPASQVDRSFFSFAVKVGGDPMDYAAAVRGAVQDVDADMPVYWLRTLEQWLAIGTFSHRFAAGLFGIFALFAVMLAGAGIYAVLAYSVSQRTREIGVRRALGAGHQGIFGMMARQNGIQLLVGLLLGAVLAAGFARILSHILIGISSFDPVTYLVVILLLAAIVALASAVPALHALRISPQEALRHE
ncbi:MAG: ABC transporter permease [Xanthomonadales bacterium]|nr:ABC transporter permease [Xanthomonadales bacterium]